MYSLEKGIFSNLFMVESVFEDLHPLYMRTADYIDQVAGFIMRSGDMGDIEVDVDDYVNAEAIHEYRRILTGAVESGRVKLNRSTEKVPHPEAATVTSCWLKRLEPSRMEKGRKGLFWLDAVMVAEIDIVQSENSCTDAMRKRIVPYRKLAESGTALRRDHVRQWFRLRGYMDLMGRRSELVQSIMIYDKRDRRPDKPYTKSLRPIFRKSEMNCEGERILKKHRLWEKAVKRGYVDAFELADKMGLTPVPVRLSRNYLIRAELFLHNAVVRVYKPDGTDEYIDVKAGTILYDTVFGVDRCERPELYSYDGKRQEGMVKPDFSSFPWGLILESAGSARLAHNEDSRELYKEEVSLDDPASENNPAFSVRPEHEVKDEEEAYAEWRKKRISKMRDAMERPTERQKEIAMMYFRDKKSQEEIAGLMGKTQQYVSKTINRYKENVEKSFNS